MSADAFGDRKKHLKPRNLSHRFTGSYEPFEMGVGTELKSSKSSVCNYPPSFLSIPDNSSY